MTNLKRLLLAAFLLVGLMGVAVAASMEDQILERIKPLGEVCVAGQACGEGGGAAASTAAAASEPRGAEEVYNTACAACHGTGAAGAPVMGQTDDWAPRIAKGEETLIDHAINGFNAMPPKGACSSCSDEEVISAMEYMVQNSQ